MPKFLDVTDKAAARTALQVPTVAVSHYVANAASYEAAIAAAVQAAGAGGVVDFEGVNYVTTGTVTVSTNGVTLQNGGIVPTGEFPALAVTGDDVIVANMTFSRANTHADVTATTPEKCCVWVSGERFTSRDCDYLDAHVACLYLVNGQCNGLVVSGGRMTSTGARQNASGVYAAAGAAGHVNITVDGVHVYDSTDGVLLFDTSDSVIANCRVEGLRRLPEITVTGWSNVTGNVWRARSASGTPGVDGVVTDREDGSTNSITVDGIVFGEVGTSTSPLANRYSVNGGYLYINLDGTNPNTVTILSRIVSGYAYMAYKTAQVASDGVSRNRIVNNVADDCDGFGVYLQVGGNADCVDNKIIGNTLTNVCLKGRQHHSLPFAGIGITGGSSTILADNTVDTVGSAGFTAPGVNIAFPPSFSGRPSGQAINNVVRNSLSQGWQIDTANWTFADCRADDNTTNGFMMYPQGSGWDLSNISFVNCHAHSNGVDGFSFDASAPTLVGSISRVSIIGGSATENTLRGIQLRSASGSANHTDALVLGVHVAENGVAGSSQILLVNSMNNTVISNCHVAHATSGVYGITVQSACTNTVTANNTFDISNPTNYAADVDEAVYAVDGAVSNIELVDATLTDPKIDVLNDLNGNAVIEAMPSANAVNYLKVQNKPAAGGAIGIYADGSDTAIALALWPKGTAGIQMRSLSAGVFFVAEPVASGVNYALVKSAVTGSPVLISAAGSDTNIGINLAPKGSGTVQAGGNPVAVKVAVPASAGAAGVPGQWAAESGWLYICVAADTWERVAIASW